MAGFTNYLEAALLDHILTDPAYAPPATLYLALSTTTPTEAGANFTEPVGGSYARKSTTASDWSAASGGDPSTKTTTGALSFATASGSWGTVTHFGIYDALSNGNLLVWDQLTAQKTIGSGDTATFGIGALVLKLGDPADSY